MDFFFLIEIPHLKYFPHICLFFLYRKKNIFMWNWCLLFKIIEIIFFLSIKFINDDVQYGVIV